MPTNIKQPAYALLTYPSISIFLQLLQLHQLATMILEASLVYSSENYTTDRSSSSCWYIAGASSRLNLNSSNYSNSSTQTNIFATVAVYPFSGLDNKPELPSYSLQIRTTVAVPTPQAAEVRLTIWSRSIDFCFSLSFSKNFLTDMITYLA